MLCGVYKACSHRDCNRKEICQESMNCKWDGWYGCLNMSSSKECGLNRACNDYKCQDEKVCNEVTNCKWDKWNGCQDKWSPTNCGLGRACNDYKCQDEKVCNKATNCKWDKWIGCQAIEPDLQCIEEKDMAYDDPGRGGGFYILYKETKEECACACKDEEKCNFFTWNKKDKQCQMITTIVKETPIRFLFRKCELLHKI